MRFLCPWVVHGQPRRALDGAAFAIRGDTLLHWTPEGYDARKPRPRHIAIDVFTPPAILEVLSAGYEPRWHPSVENGPTL
jgi:hypothetical protein